MSMESVIGTILTKLRKIDVDYNTTIPSRQRMRTSKFNPKKFTTIYYNMPNISHYTYTCQELFGAVQSGKPPQNQPPGANQSLASKTIAHNMTSDQR